MKHRRDPLLRRVRRVYTIRDVVAAYIVGGVAFLALMLFSSYA